ANFGALDLARVKTLCAPHIHSDFDQSTQVAAQFRNAHARSRRRSAQCPGITRARQPFDYANLHARHCRTPEESLLGRASARVTKQGAAVSSPPLPALVAMKRAANREQDCIE